MARAHMKLEAGRSPFRRGVPDRIGSEEAEGRTTGIEDEEAALEVVELVELLLDEGVEVLEDVELLVRLCEVAALVKGLDDCSVLELGDGIGEAGPASTWTWAEGIGAALEMICTG